MPWLPPVDMLPQASLLARFTSGATYSARTLLQSASSSSATNCARPVHVPCPISDRAIRTTVVSSGLMTAQMPTAAPPPACASAGPPPPGIFQPSAKPPPAAAAATMNRRRSSLMVSLMVPPPSRVVAVGRGVDRIADALIGAAAADVRHRRVDIGVGRLGRLGQQRHRRHDLAGLAVAAL